MYFINLQRVSTSYIYHSPSLASMPVFRLHKCDNDIPQDTYHGFLDTVGYLYMQWSDARLAWNASDYGNLESLRVPREMIWNPDIDVYNV